MIIRVVEIFLYKFSMFFIENEILNENILLECSFGFLFYLCKYFIVKF